MPGLEQVHHVLPALGVPHARRVGVRELVDQDHLRLARDRGVDVELLELDPAVRDPLARQHLEVVDQLGGLGAPVGLDDADHDVGALRAQPPRGLEHRVGLADARRRAEEDLEPAHAPAPARAAARRDPAGRRRSPGEATAPGQERVKSSAAPHEPGAGDDAQIASSRALPPCRPDVRTRPIPADQPDRGARQRDQIEDHARHEHACRPPRRGRRRGPARAA